MPNYCTASINVNGPKEELDKFQQALNKGEDGCFEVLQSLVPMPEELKGTKSPGDNPNWYDWQQKNWGCKWGDCETQLDRTTDENLCIQTMFPWNPPIQGFTKIAELFPTLSITMEYEELGMGFRGDALWKNGELKYDNCEEISEEEYDEKDDDEDDSEEDEDDSEDESPFMIWRRNAE